MPPMDDQPPGEFVTFVGVHLRDLQQEAARLTGGLALPADGDYFIVETERGTRLCRPAEVVREIV